MTKQLVRYALAVMTTLLALLILWQFRIVVIYVLISVTLAATLRPLVTPLVGKSFLVRAAWVLLYLLVLGSFGYLIYLAGRAALMEIQHLANIVSLQDEWRLPAWLEGSLFKQVLVSRLLSPSKLFQLATYGQARFVLPAVLGFTQGVAGLVSGVVIILILSLYWITNKNYFERLWLSLLPSGQRKQARDVWQTIEPDLGDYIRSQIIYSLLAGLLLGLGYWVIGSPYLMLLSFFVALACLIPFVGSVVAVIIPLLVGVLTGMPYTLLMVVYTLVVVTALGVWVKPRLFYRRWDNPILTLVILIALANAFGLIGVLIAPPLSAVCQILWSLLVNQRLASGTVAQYTDFKQRQEKVWATIKIMDEPPPPMVFNTMERLTRLIERAESLVQANQTTSAPDSSSPNPHQPGQQ